MPSDILSKNSALLRPANEVATMNLNAAAAPAMAAANFGGALEGLGEKGAAIATQMQEAKNAGSMADLRLRMREHRAVWERDVMPDLPAEKRLEGWQKASEEFQGQITQEEMAPTVRAGFEQTYKDFSGNTGLDVQAGAYKEMMAGAKASHIAAADGALAMGDIVTAHEEIDAIPGLPQHEKEIIKSEQTKRHEWDVAESAARDGALDSDAERPSTMHEKDWKRLQRTNQINEARIQGEAIDRLWDSKIEGKVETQGHWDTKVDEDPDLTDAQKVTMKERFKLTTPLTDDELSDYRDRIANLKSQRAGGTISQEDYEQAYYDLSDDLKLEGDRTKARDLREIVGSMSPDTLAKLEQTRLKSARDVIQEDVMIDYTERLASLRETTEISDGRAKAIRAQADRNFERLLQHENPDEISQADLLQMKKKAWDDAVHKRSNRSPADVIFGEKKAADKKAKPATHPLLPPKRNTSRGG